MTRIKSTAFTVLVIILAVVLIGGCFFNKSTVTKASAVEVSAPHLSQVALVLDMDTIGKLFPLGFSNEEYLVWTSQDSNVADVRYGRVLPASPGETIITCTDGTNSAQCKVTVTTGKINTNYRLCADADYLNLQIGDSSAAKYTYTGKQPVTVFSNDPQVLQVENGRYTALSEGTAVITVTDGIKQTQCFVKVMGSSPTG